MNVYRDGHVSILHGWKSRVWLSFDHSFKSFTKILFHWSCDKDIPRLLVSLEVTHTFLETTYTVFHFENPNAAGFTWWGWEEQGLSQSGVCPQHWLNSDTRRKCTGCWGQNTQSVGPHGQAQCAQGWEEGLTALEPGIVFKKLVNVSWVPRG